MDWIVKPVSVYSWIPGSRRLIYFYLRERINELNFTTRCTTDTPEIIIDRIGNVIKKHFRAEIKSAVLNSPNTYKSKNKSSILNDGNYFKHLRIR